MRNPVLAGLILSLVFSFAGHAAQDLDSARAFSTAKDLYKEGQYDSVVVTLRTFLKDHGKEPSTRYMVPLLMEALVRVEDYEYFDRLIRIYRQKFQSSEYLPRLAYLEGLVLARQEKCGDAVLSFSKALSSGINPSLDQKALANVKMICEKVLTGDELGHIGAEPSLAPRLKEMVAYYEFAKLDAEGKALKAGRRAAEFREEFPDSKYTAFAKDVINRSKSVSRNSISMALLAPVSGYDSEVGKSLVEAVQLAVDQHNATNTPQVHLVIRDTKSSMIETARITHDVVVNQGVRVIIGPCLSQNAIVTASMIMDKDVVMITPTATDDGIARLGRSIFQVNVTPSMLGRRIARYAMENLNISEFAILSPLSDYGRILTESFKETVESKGAEIVAEEYFNEGASDFRIQFENLRKRLAARRKENMAIAEGIDYVETRHSKRADSLYLADSTMAVGGLFIPAESEDVVMLAPQVYFHRLRTQLLGSAGWQTSATITDGKRYVNDAIISSSFEVGGKSEAWRAFSDAYWKRFKAEPDRVAAPLGYDAANVLLRGLMAVANDDAGKLTEWLLNVKDYRGVSGTISFDPQVGVNTETAIVKIKDKEFVRLQ